MKLCTLGQYDADALLKQKGAIQTFDSGRNILLQYQLDRSYFVRAVYLCKLILHLEQM